MKNTTCEDSSGHARLQCFVSSPTVDSYSSLYY